MYILFFLLLFVKNTECQQYYSVGSYINQDNVDKITKIISEIIPLQINSDCLWSFHYVTLSSINIPLSL